MTRLRCRVRKAVLFAVMIALLLAPAVSAQAKGKGFKDVVKHIETNYRAKKTRIPLLGLANFAVKLIRPAGVKGFKLAVFEDQDFSPRPGAQPFHLVMRESYNKDWQPLLQINSNRSGNSRTYIYARTSGKDVQFAMVTMQDREAVVLEVKFNPDAAARFLENPKIMGISLGNSIRGNSGSVAARTPRRSPNTTNSGSSNRISNGDRTIAEMDADSAAEPNPRPALTTSANDENNPPISAAAAKTDVKTEQPIAATGVKEVKEVKSEVPGIDTIRIETRLVNLNVKAMDRAGQPITDLKLEDFAVYEDGIKQNVEHFKPVNAPVNTVLLLDLSGSTRKKRQAMKEAARRFVDALPAEDQISVVAFTRRYRALTGFTRDRAKLKRVLEEINGIDGGTAFYDATWKALDDLDRITDARKAIVVLTDGEDESLVGNEETIHTFEELLDRASEEDVTIYPIYFKASSQHYDKLGLIFGGGNFMGNENVRQARKQLDQLAEMTGGEVVNAQREEDLESAYHRVATELHTLYSMAYSPDKLKHNGEFRKIGVKINREGSVAKTRRGYYDR